MKDTSTSILELIEKYDTITIYGHRLPDPDCYGCQVGLKRLIKNTYPNKEVYILGKAVPSLVERFGEMDDVDDDTIKRSLAILVDVLSFERVEDPRVALAKEAAVIDHHEVEAAPEAKNYWIRPNRVSASEMVAELGFEGNMKYDSLAAEALYSGMASDSGRFMFFGTNQKTFETIYRLSKFGIDFKALFELLFAVEPKVKAFADYLESQVVYTGEIAHAYITKEEYLSRGLDYEGASDMVNTLMHLGKPIYMLVTEDGNGYARVELRSKSGYHVQPVAVMFGGGGHLHAAGCTIKEKSDEYHAIIDELNKLNNVEE